MAAADLLERDGELEALSALLTEARLDAGRPILIEGQAGIGKSRLLAELGARAADDGWTVLTARGSELEREFPFGVVRQLFEPLVAATGGDELLTGAAASARAVFGAPGADGDELHDASFAALHGLHWLTLNASAQQPLLLSIDDLHWCDRPSLRFVAYLVHRLEGQPIVVAATVRMAEAGTDPALLGEFAQHPAAAPVRPGPLSAAAVRDLVQERLDAEPADAFAAACHRATGGNPLLLRQLLTELAAEGVAPSADQVELVAQIGPRAITRTVLLRLARLPDDAVAVARAVAVLGDAAELPIVAALAGLDESRVATSTGGLVRAEILSPRTPLAFVHALVRDAVYLDLPPGERDLQHARAARLLFDAGAPAEQVASHVLLSARRGEPWIVDVLHEAGRASVRSGAVESAVASMRRALEEGPTDAQRITLLQELGLTQAQANVGLAIQDLRAAYELQEDPPSRAQIAYWLARIQLFADPRAARALAGEAIAELPAELVDERQGLQAVESMAIIFGAGDRETLGWLRPDRLRVEGSGPGARMLQAVAAHNWALTGGPADECASLALAALAGGELVRAGQGLFDVTAAIVLVFADREEAADILDAVLDEAHRRGSAFAALAARLWRGYHELWRGELADADEALGVAMEQMQLWGTESDAVWRYPVAFRATVATERGDLAAARAWLARVGAPVGPSAGANYLRRSTIELLLAEGRPEEALAMAAEYAESLGPIADPFAPWRSLKAIALDRLGRTDEALPFARAEIELARAWGAPTIVGRALRVLGQIEREEGIATLEDAVEVLERASAKLERAKGLHALGSTLRRAGRPTDAREPLRRALELADAAGAEGLADEMRTELYATGVRPRTTALSGVDSLTASEARVAALAAEGHTNRDIAQSLYVTPKTVEVHLSNTYRKLGIRSRRELEGAL